MVKGYGVGVRERSDSPVGAQELSRGSVKNRSWIRDNTRCSPCTPQAAGDAPVRETPAADEGTGARPGHRGRGTCGT